ncbi:hypothetical protein [Actinoplanes sp. L3-i22]|uniref:hypothetical protein n=1 Tax=Actinoplanes sp. L3-i22 TaxID=2836373 RepID=UPI002106B6AA|nr:hypothetical protein [Actinoplanes sp. L3-i22]
MLSPQQVSVGVGLASAQVNRPPTLSADQAALVCSRAGTTTIVCAWVVPDWPYVLSPQQ